MNASKVPSRTVDNYDLSTRIIPGQKAFSLFTRRSNHRPIHGFRLSAIDNAETPDGARVDAPSSGTIAGGVVGLGAAEVARRELSDAQIRELVQGEIDERLAAAREIDVSHTERAAALRAEAAVLRDLLGDV
jgi:hypothetical protein